MHPTLVLNVVGLTPELLGPHTPQLNRLAERGAHRTITATTPAVTCTAQATYLTGRPVSAHGIVANGWYFHDLAEIWLWRQSNHLVQAEPVWDVARRRDPAFTVAQLFWWYNMYSSADVSVTPRPMYLADGRKLPDCYTEPAELRDLLQAELGQFPLFKFWGPLADITCTRWITDAALFVQERFDPTLHLVYLPHLDYNLQRLGPSDPNIARDLELVDTQCGRLMDAAMARGMRVVVLSEYGITEVKGAIHINRILRQQGFLRVRNEAGREMLDAGASRAFAVADHQLAHVYVQDSSVLSLVRAALEGCDGIESVWDKTEQAARGIAHARSGEFVVLSQADRWFSYYFWLDDAHAPDYARTVDIHRKPGYDPVELFLDPQLPWGRWSVGAKILRRKLGFRGLLDVIPLDDQLVRGSHGRPTDDPRKGPLFLSSEPRLMAAAPPRVEATDVARLLLRHLFDD